jgi:hypothetical protein
MFVHNQQKVIFFAFVYPKSSRLILNHPPYVDIIKYSDNEIEQDLSNIHDLDEFCDEIEKVAKEFYRTFNSGCTTTNHGI